MLKSEIKSSSTMYDYCTENAQLKAELAKLKRGDLVSHMASIEQQLQECHDDRVKLMQRLDEPRRLQEKNDAQFSTIQFLIYKTNYCIVERQELQKAKNELRAVRQELKGADQNIKLIEKIYDREDIQQKYDAQACTIAELQQQLQQINVFRQSEQRLIQPSSTSSSRNANITDERRHDTNEQQLARNNLPFFQEQFLEFACMWHGRCEDLTKSKHTSKRTAIARMLYFVFKYIAMCEQQFQCTMCNRKFRLQNINDLETGHLVPSTKYTDASKSQYVFDLCVEYLRCIICSNCSKGGSKGQQMTDDQRGSIKARWHALSSQCEAKNSLPQLTSPINQRLCVGNDVVTSFSDFLEQQLILHEITEAVISKWMSVSKKDRKDS